MALKSPIGLLTIRDETGDLKQTAAFKFYQNAVDYCQPLLRLETGVN